MSSEDVLIARLLTKVSVKSNKYISVRFIYAYIGKTELTYRDPRPRGRASPNQAQDCILYIAYQNIAIYPTIFSDIAKAV